MKGEVETSDGGPESPFTWGDAGILAGAVFGLLMGVSLLSVQASVIIGILLLAFVVYKLFTTKS